MKAIEFFCGIGGFAAAFKGEVCLAIDQDQFAVATYNLNFTHPTMTKTIGSVSTDVLAGHKADLWWASPPCQPFTVKGARRLLSDKRAEPLVQLLHHLDKVRPQHFAMENVLGFANSPGETLVQQTLRKCGYAYLQTIQICPTQFGIPNRRPRFFLVASQSRLNPIHLQSGVPLKPLSGFLQTNDPKLGVPNLWLEKFHAAMDILSPHHPGSVAQTFTSGYGKSPARCGSYIDTGNGQVRFFSPGEIANLLGLPEGFRFSKSSTPRQSWKRLGNSLSIPVIKYVLQAFPGNH